MKSLLLAAALAASPGNKPKECPRTTIVLLTPEGWSAMDQINFNLAKKRCPVKYKRSPCLKKFIRWGKLRYSAICGARPE
jgi:hypothetical protein